MTGNGPDEVVFELRDLYIEDDDETRTHLVGLTEWSRVFASASFRVGDVDLAAWVRENVQFVDLPSWLAYPRSLVRDLQTRESRHVFFEREADDAFVFSRRGNEVELHEHGQHVATCDHTELVAKIEAAHAWVRALFLSLGEPGRLWWEDAFEVLSLEWEAMDDETFFAHRHSWYSGPFFEVNLSGSAPEALTSALVSRPDIERREALHRTGARWICRVPGLEHRIGFVYDPGDTRLSFPPHHVARACRLPDDACEVIWPSRPCPTPQTRLFLRWLVGLVEQLATSAPVESAVLVDEASAPPGCAIESGYVYVYAMAEIGEETSDPRFNRVPLREA